MSSLPKVQCSVCSRVVAVRITGEYREHTGSVGGHLRCAGSGESSKASMAALGPRDEQDHDDPIRRLTTVILCASCGNKTEWRLSFGGRAVGCCPKCSDRRRAEPSFRVWSNRQIRKALKP